MPAELRTIVAKALEPEPADRYQTMRDLVVDLRRLARRPESRKAHSDGAWESGCGADRLGSRAATEVWPGVGSAMALQ